MNVLTISAVVLLAATICTSLKRHIPEYCVVINICAGLIITSALISNAVPILSHIKNLCISAKIPNEYSCVLFKSMGTCFLAQFASDSCKDAGEISLAGKVELAGKIGIMVAALPLFEKIAETALGFMGAH